MGVGGVRRSLKVEVGLKRDCERKNRKRKRVGGVGVMQVR